MEVPEHEQRRRRALGELAGRTDHGQGISCVLRNGCRCVSHGQSQPGVAVPGRQAPVFGAGERRDLADGLVGLVGLDPEAGEAGGDEFMEAGGERGWAGGGCVRVGGWGQKISWLKVWWCEMTAPGASFS